MKKKAASWVIKVGARTLLVQGLAPHPWEQNLTVLEYAGMDGSRPAQIDAGETWAILVALGAPADLLDASGDEGEMIF